MADYLFMLAQQADRATTQQGNPLLMIVFMVVFIAFFYFVVIRPQNKQKKEMQNMLNALKKGDKIVTIGGIIGKVASIQENQVTIRVNDSNTEITFEKGAIAKVVTAAKSESNPEANVSSKSAESKDEKKDDKKEDKNEEKKDQLFGSKDK